MGTRQGTTSLGDVRAELADTERDVDHQVHKATLSRYRSFSAAASQHLSGDWASAGCRAGDGSRC